MKDIKSLYDIAKFSGKHSDIMNYTEAVKELLENHPNEFISNLEYIINSDIGVTRLDDFVEKYGLSVALYNKIMACLESCHEMYIDRNLDTSIYDMYIEKYEMFKRDHQNCINMFESFSNENNEMYINTYYSFNDKGVQNSRLIAGMLDKFGEMAIPDILIVANKYGSSTFESTLKYLYVDKGYNDPVKCQWISECVHDVNPSCKSEVLIRMESGSIGAIVNNLRNRNSQILRESVLTGKHDMMYEYTECEIQALKDYISYNEYKLTGLENANDIMNLQNVIYSLYEEFDGIIGENDMYVSESSEQGSVKKKLSSLCKDIRKKIHAAIKSEVKSYNSDKKLGARIPMCFIYSSFGDDDGIYNNQFTAKKHIKEILDNQRNNNSEFIDNFRIYLILRVEVGMPLKDSKLNVAGDLYKRTALNAIGEFVDNGSIAISKDKFVKMNDKEFDSLKKNSNIEEYYYTYTVYTYTWKIPVYVSRKLFFDDKQLNENADAMIECAIDDIATMNREEYLNEVSWLSNTRNKKTGEAPGYLRNNHNLGWGETDTGSSNENDSESDGWDEDKTDVDSYKRPSAGGDTSSSWDDDQSDDRKGYDHTGSTNNYYYYTYNNSLNKNSHSFNKDSSSHDNHSRHDNSVTNDSSVHNSTRRVTDDHSTNKRYQSNDYNGSTYDDEVESESSKPWELNIFGDNSFRESKNIEDEFDKILDKHIQFRKECSSETETQSKLFKYLYKKNIDSVKLESVPDTITIKIGNIDFTFRAEVGNGYIEDGKTSISDFSQVPCAVYLFQTNKDKICKKLGIEDELKKYIKILYDEDPSYYDNKTADGSIDDLLKRYNFKAKSIYFNQLGHLGFYFDTDIEPEHGVGVSISPSMKTHIGDGATYIFESVGDADDLKPESDHPIKDMLQDIDKKAAGVNQKIKQKVQNVQNAGKAAMKPVNRTKDWIQKIIFDWKDADENKIKEKMADPHARKNIFNAITASIKAGSLLKAGLLLNPVFVGLTLFKKKNAKKNEFRIRNEMIGELKTELKILDEKIKDAGYAHDKKAKYEMMRLKNEIQKKLIRVGGGPGVTKSI